MLVFYCYVVGGWSGSSVMFMLLQLVSAYKEQQVDNYGVSILIIFKKRFEQSFIAFKGVFLHFKTTKNVMHENF